MNEHKISRLHSNQFPCRICIAILSKKKKNKQTKYLGINGLIYKVGGGDTVLVRMRAYQAQWQSPKEHNIKGEMAVEGG